MYELHQDETFGVQIFDSDDDQWYLRWADFDTQEEADEFRADLLTDAMFAGRYKQAKTRSVRIATEVLETPDNCSKCGHPQGAHGDVRWFSGEIEFRCTAREEPGGSFAGPCGCEGDGE